MFVQPWTIATIKEKEKNQEVKKPGSKENWGCEGKNVIIKNQVRLA